MPKGSRKGRKEKKVVSSVINDVTLNDYADAAKCPSATLRVKKGDANSFKTENLSKDGERKANDDLSWFEKDLEEFHIGSDEDKSDKEDTEQDTASVPVKVTRRRRKSRRLDSSEGEVNVGCEYPLDLWYQLSAYIHPEDVGRFAAICQTTYSLVCTSTFWRQLYTRNYKKKIKLPAEIKPASIERVRGLRARVIRSMFYLYLPFADRSKPSVPFENEPHDLQGQRCLLAWHQPVKNMWNFCFKFTKSQTNTFRPAPVKVPSVKDMLPGYSDLFFNPEEGCRILEVRCQNFVSIPMVMGLMLNRVYLTMGARMRHYRLRLLFDTNLRDSNTGPAETTVDLDPVVNIRVLPWWDPKYPFTF